MKKIFALAIFLLGAQSLSARDRQSFDKGWLFTLADSAGMSKSDYSDRHWRSLNLPHDWAIEGDFSPSNPSGASGGALPGGIGCSHWADIGEEAQLLTHSEQTLLRTNLGCRVVVETWV